MNRISTTLFASIVAITISFGQITTTKVAPKVEVINNNPYDSLNNFLYEDVDKYVGQEFYLKGKEKLSREFGYEGFILDYTDNELFDQKNIYYCTSDHFCSIYDSLAGKYFKVLGAIKHPKAAENKYFYDKKCYLKLQEKVSNDIVYYAYDCESKYYFPFIVVGYFIKLKQTQIGKKFVVRGKNWYSDGAMTDMNTGIPVTNFEAGKIWKCVDVTIEEKRYQLSLIIQNEKGEQIPLSADNATNDYCVFEATRAERLKKRFGSENWQTILEGKVKIGMTKEMCLLSWGTPDKINETITAGKNSQQWVYYNGYIYLTNGIVTSIQ